MAAKETKIFSAASSDMVSDTAPSAVTGWFPTNRQDAEALDHLYTIGRPEPAAAVQAGSRTATNGAFDPGETAIEALTASVTLMAPLHPTTAQVAEAGKLGRCMTVGLLLASGSEKTTYGTGAGEKSSARPMEKDSMFWVMLTRANSAVPWICQVSSRKETTVSQWWDDPSAHARNTLFQRSMESAIRATDALEIPGPPTYVQAPLINFITDALFSTEPSMNAR